MEDGGRGVDAPKRQELEAPLPQSSIGGGPFGRRRWGMMTLEEKLDILMTLATDDHDSSGSSSGPVQTLPPRLRHTKEVGALRPLNIRTVQPGNGRRVPLLRILMTNACSYN